MSINLSRRDALKGAMAAGAAIAATPYLLNLTGGFEASPVQNTPVPPLAASSPAASSDAVAQSAGETTVLVIKGDVVSSYSGQQSIKVQDAVLAARLKGAIWAQVK